MQRERIQRALEAAGQRIACWLQDRQREAPPITRGNHRKRKRFYLYTPTEGRPRRLLMLGCGAVLAGVLLFSGGKLLGYGADYLRSRQASKEMRRLYYQTVPPTQAPTARQAEAVLPVPEVTVAPTQAPTASPAPREGKVPRTAETTIHLQQVPYPDNPYCLVSDRFQRIRRQNKDIVGWLTIDSLLEEVVVQRDNEYYLRRDHLGYHNTNGAIFLDENCKLKTRPYTLMLYGHNMKTGAMFGSLRNYESLDFYRKNPFITFDTMYEEGRYVIFSVGTFSTVATDWQYVNLSWLVSSSATLRQQAIAQLNRFSRYMNTIDVRPDDQILLLITCVDDEDDRRMVAARRIREGESEDALRRTIRVTTTK